MSWTRIWEVVMLRMLDCLRRFSRCDTEVASVVEWGILYLGTIRTKRL